MLLFKLLVEKDIEFVVYEPFYEHLQEAFGISYTPKTFSKRDEIDSEIQIFQNALEFSGVKAREVMIPRTEVVAVEVHTTPKELGQLFTDTGLSKILVFNKNIDDILGYVHSFELFKKPKTIKPIAGIVCGLIYSLISE